MAVNPPVFISSMISCFLQFFETGCVLVAFVMVFHVLHRTLDSVCVPAACVGNQDSARCHAIPALGLGTAALRALSSERGSCTLCRLP